ncbi:ABC transporter permease [Micromonospora soli]|uniref:ABC transporter permease n=1 Tax=Micromonospora sp. NBRC 110009 TaxID=3061627 RepID=UPI0026728F83|nr:ABC transporter permease [Micromonospora sp. NBRC 110009]WKT97017.1 ABC transporter permease [Micromonospora sp. NBRC 110009]
MTTTAAPVGTPTTRRRPGIATVVRWEVSKLAAQARSRALLIGAIVVPIAVVLIFNTQLPPKDTIYGRHIHTSGYAVPLFVLAFAHQWVLPLLAALVAGDIFANEDQHGTWKTILTRSVSRSQVFWAKTLTAICFNLLVLVLLAASAITTSLLVVGTQPLPGLSGQLISAGHALPLVIASWATAVAPVLGFTALAILLSVTTRNPTIGVATPVVLGMIMQLLSSLGGLNKGRRLLLTTPFETWHGMLTAQPFHAPIVTGVAVSAGWLIACLTLAYLYLRRRDITGG